MAMVAIPSHLLYRYILYAVLLVSSFLSIYLSLKSIARIRSLRTNSRPEGIARRVALSFLFGLLLPTIFIAAVSLSSVSYLFDTGLHIQGDVENVNDVQYFVGRTNSLLLEDLRVIDVSNDWYAQLLSDSPGTYYAFSRTLFLDLNLSRNVSSSQSLESVWWHELGHHIWHYLLNDTERDGFTGLHMKDEYYELTGDHGYFPTNYAMKNVQEDFSESFSRWVIDDINGEFHWAYRTERLDPERAHIIRQSIRRITHCELDDAVRCVFSKTI